MQVLYLPGFASGPSSTKASAYADHFAARGITVDRMDLRKPSFEHLRLTAMIQHVRDSLRGDAVLIGSSLGGLTAARVAERNNQIKTLVLLAPAFRLVHRWQQQHKTKKNKKKHTNKHKKNKKTKNGPSK